MLHRNFACALCMLLFAQPLLPLRAAVVFVSNGTQLEVRITEPITFEVDQTASLLAASLIFRDALINPAPGSFSTSGTVVMTFEDATVFNPFSEFNMPPGGMSVSGPIFSNIPGMPPWTKPYGTTRDLVVSFSAFGPVASVSPGQNVVLGQGSIFLQGPGNKLNTGLNESGSVLVGFGELTDFDTAGRLLASPVSTQLIPEPSTAFLLILAGLGMVIVRRRTKRTAELRTS